MTSKTPISRSMVAESTPKAIGEVCDWIMPNLEDNDFSQEDIFAIHLALEEAFSNAIKHGNQMDSDREVKIDYSLAPDRIELCITDEGEGFDPESVPDPRFGENLYKPAGRGLFLMRSFMDVVKFNERGNSVRMVKYKDKARLIKDSR